ncbi:hypothetical protein Tco_1375556 [Tanacetum coccineum]
MPYPRFTKIIINHFLKQHKPLTNLNYKHYHTIKDDGIVSQLKFVRIGEDYQEYGHPIPDVMLTNAIKHSESYQMFIKYLTNQIPPKKSRGKGSKGKETVEESQETVDVSEESETEPEPAKKKTASRRFKKKVTPSANDNIISDDPDAALELAKSISQTEAEEAEEARKVHATHARIMPEYFPEFAKKKSSGKSSKSVVIQDTSSAPTSKPATSKTKLKGASSLTLAEQEAANIMQTLKESKKTSRRQPGTRGSNEGTGSEPGVPDESTVGSTTPSEGTGVKPGVPDEDKDITEEKMDEKDGDTDDEGDDRVSSDKGDEEIIDAAKEEAEKTSEAKDDTKKIELPPSSSSLSISSGFGDQFLKISSDSSLVSTVKDSADADVSSLLDIPIQHETPRSSLHQCRRFSYHTPIISTIQQTTTPIPTPKITTNAPTITIVVPKSNALTAVELRVAKLEKYVSELKTGDHSSVALVVLQSYVPTVVDSYLDTKVRDVFQKELQKHTAYLIHKYSLQHLPELTKKPTPTTEPEFEKSPSEILKIKKEQAESQKNPQFTIKSTDKAALEEYDLKSALYQSMHANKSFNRNPANHRLYHALMEALIEDENAMDKGVADTGKKTKRRRTKESESSKKPSSTKETPKGKTPTKGSKTGKSASAKELVEEPIVEVIMDDAGDDLVHDDDQPQAASKPKTSKTLNPKCVSANKLHGYGHLEEIVVKRSDQQLYKFKEGDFVDLHLNDIEDMLLLAVQHKLFHLDGNVIVDFIVALRMFTRSLILKRRVEDLQLGIAIMAQVHANADLSSELLGADMNDDNFAERMLSLRRSALAVADLKSQELRSTLKRAGKALEPDTSKKQKSTEAPIPSVPDVPQPLVVSSPKSFGTRRKSLGRSRITKPKSVLTELDLDADDKTFTKLVSDEDSEDEAPILWSAFADLQVLMDSQAGGKGSLVWNHQSHWHILSWRLYTLSNVHVLETISGEVLYMFSDVSYPLSVKLMERMLKHKLEIDKDVVGNDMTTAEQLIQFIKNQIAAAQVSPV